MPTKRQIEGWIRMLEKRKKALAKERDALNDLLDELEELRGSCDAALEALQNAVEHLSELV